MDVCVKAQRFEVKYLRSAVESVSSNIIKVSILFTCLRYPLNLCYITCVRARSPVDSGAATHLNERTQAHAEAVCSQLAGWKRRRGKLQTALARYPLSVLQGQVYSTYVGRGVRWDGEKYPPRFLPVDPNLVHSPPGQQGVRQGPTQDETVDKPESSLLHISTKIGDIPVSKTGSRRAHHIAFICKKRTLLMHLRARPCSYFMAPGFANVASRRLHSCLLGTCAVFRNAVCLMPDPLVV